MSMVKIQWMGSKISFYLGWGNLEHVDWLGCRTPVGEPRTTIEEDHKLSGLVHSSAHSKQCQWVSRPKVTPARKMILIRKF